MLAGCVPQIEGSGRAVRHVHDPARAGLLLGYGAIEADDIGEGLRRLGRAFALKR
jgi:hypothetical protein